MRCICRIVQVEREFFSFFRGESARRPAEMATADLLKDSKPPLTLRPNFNCEKGSVTADKPPVCPAGGVLLVEIKPPLKGEGDRR